MKTMLMGLAVLMLCMSAALFSLMGADKRLAKTGRRRVPEKTLFLLALLFGAPGGLLGMNFFRHKTRHWYFVWGFRLLTLLQLGLLGWLAYRLSM
jgi:uncharacterized membrane protein YsdA (DUF1294 family)